MPYSDLDRLFEFCVPFAQDQLRKRGRFDPFAAMVKADSTLSPMAYYDDKEIAGPKETVSKLIEIFRSLLLQEELQASAICYNGRVAVPGKEDQNAIIVSMERVSGVAITMSIPYSKKFIRGYKFEDAFRIAAEPVIFDSASVSRASS